jgi:hypothetical protein
MGKKGSKQEEKVEDKSVNPIDTNLSQMEGQLGEYLDLYQRLKDEGIVNIGVLENKIAKLSEDIKKIKG